MLFGLVVCSSVRFGSPQKLFSNKSTCIFVQTCLLSWSSRTIALFIGTHVAVSTKLGEWSESLNKRNGFAVACWAQWSVRFYHPNHKHLGSVLCSSAKCSYSKRLWIENTQKLWDIWFNYDLNILLVNIMKWSMLTTVFSVIFFGRRKKIVPPSGINFHQRKDDWMFLTFVSIKFGSNWILS